MSGYKCAPHQHSDMNRFVSLLIRYLFRSGHVKSIPVEGILKDMSVDSRLVRLLWMRLCFLLSGDLRMVDILLVARADPEIRNRRGRTPYQLARHTAIREVLDKWRHGPCCLSITDDQVVFEKDVPLRNNNWTTVHDEIEDLVNAQL